MIVYKYKSLGDSTCSLEQDKQLGYLKDICKNNQLYASDFNVMDDPMEGIFDSYLGNDNSYIMDICYGKINTHICSLSPTYQSMLMWSFYANQHRGCCIEVEISDEELKNVDYVTNPMNVDSSTIEYEKKIEKILLRKYKDWAFEKELRILTKNRFVNVCIKKIYFGMRVTDYLFEKYKADIQNWNPQIKVEKMTENMFVHIDTTSNNNQ